jgi:hypothetical protein
VSDPPRLPTEEDLIKREPVDRRLEALDQTFSHGLSSVVRSNIVNIVTVLLLAMGVFYYAQKSATTARQIKALQQQQQESQKTGRATQLQVAGIVQQGATLLALVVAQTGPTATARQQAAVAGYLASLTDAQKTLNADLLRKIGELAQCVPCSPEQVSRVLAEPVPVITFGRPAPVPTPSSSPPPTRSGAPSPTPTPSHTLTPAVQIQCPIICPPTH